AAPPPPLSGMPRRSGARTLVIALVVAGLLAAMQAWLAAVGLVAAMLMFAAMRRVRTPAWIPADDTDSRRIYHAMLGFSGLTAILLAGAPLELAGGDGAGLFLLLAGLGCGIAVWKMRVHLRDVRRASPSR